MRSSPRRPPVLYRALKKLINKKQAKRVTFFYPCSHVQIELQKLIKVSANLRLLCYTNVRKSTHLILFDIFNHRSKSGVGGGGGGDSRDWRMMMTVKFSSTQTHIKKDLIILNEK